MSWSVAQRDAAERVALILERIATLSRETGLAPPREITLSWYPAPHDYRTLRPGEDWSHEHWCAVMRAVQRQLKRHGIKVRFIDCTAADCLAWLDAQGLPSSPANRARYVGAMTRG